MKTSIKILKLIFVFFIFYYLYKNNYFDFSFFKYFKKIEIISLIVFFSFITIVLNSIRWWIILRSQSIKISLFNSFKLVYIASFFNNVLPGSYGGDIFRIYYIVKFTETKKIRASLSILLDRIYGLCGLLTLGCPIFFVIFFDKQKIYIFLFFCLILVFIFLLFLMIIKFNNQLKEKILKILKYFGINFQNFLICILISIILYFLVHCCIYLISNEIFRFKIDFFVIFFSNTVSTLAAVLPLTPGGLGISELVFVKINEEIFDLYFKNFANIIILFRLCNILVSLPSLIFCLLYKSNKN